MPSSAKGRTIVWLALLAGCGGADPFQTNSAIRNGETDTTHASAVLLTLDGQGWCSATLIGRQTALTAGHCIQPGKMELVPGALTVQAQRYRATKVAAHPDFDINTISGPDLGVVHLADRVYGVPPSAISHALVTVGQSITMVGFGSTDRATGVDWGTRRHATVTVDVVDTGPGARNYEFNQHTMGDPAACPGDSGGPAFSESAPNEIVGVHSLGSCYDGQLNFSADVRTDLFADWIAQEAGSDLYQGGAIDVTPPAIKITSPAPPHAVDTKFTVETEVTDDGKVALVEAYLAGSPKASLTSPPFNFVYSKITTGTHVLRIVATDAEGNQSTEELTLDARPRAPLGGECASGPDCASQMCAPATHTCFQSCTTSDVCPTGYSCAESSCKPVTQGCTMSRTGSPMLPGLPLALLLLLLRLFRAGATWRRCTECSAPACRSRPSR